MKHTEVFSSVFFYGNIIESKFLQNSCRKIHDSNHKNHRTLLHAR